MQDRRRKGQGSVRPGKRAGTWRLTVELPRDPATGARRQKVTIFEGAEKEANRELARLTVLWGESRDTEVTVSVLMQRYLMDTPMAPRSREEYERVIRSVLVPLFGSIELRNLTRGVIKNGWITAERQGMSLHSVGKAHRALRAALKLAMDLDWIQSNPAVRNPPRTPPRPRLAPPPAFDVQRALLRRCERELDLYVWLRLSMATGARRGEVLALRWDDFNPRARSMRFDEALTYTKGAGTYSKETKTELVKVVQLDRRTVAALRLFRYRMHRAVDRNGLILCRDAYGQQPWRPESASRKFRQLRAEVPGAERVRLHDLRHAVPTQLLAAGFNARVVADHVGHEDVATTIGLYASSLPEQQRAAADFIGRGLAR